MEGLLMEQLSSSDPGSLLREAEALELLDKIHDNEGVDEAIPKLLTIAQTLLRTPDSNLGRMMLYLRASCLELDDKVQEGNQPFQELVKCINAIAERHHLRKLPSLKHEEKTFLDRFRDVGAKVLNLVRTKEEEDLALDSEYWIEAEGLSLKGFGQAEYAGHFYPTRDWSLGAALKKWQTEENFDGVPFREMMNFKTFLETYEQHEFPSYADVNYLTKRELEPLKISFDQEGRPLLPSNQFALWIKTEMRGGVYPDTYRTFLKELPKEEVRLEPTPLPPGEYLFLMNKEGELFVAKKIRGEMEHSSLSHGKPAKSAGELTVGDNGSISSITPYSSHYKPFLKNLLPILEIFYQRSLPFNFNIVGQYYNGTSFDIPQEEINAYRELRMNFANLAKNAKEEQSKPYSMQTEALIQDLISFKENVEKDLDLREEIRQLVSKLIQKKIQHYLSKDKLKDRALIKELEPIYSKHLQTAEERLLFAQLKKKVLDSSPSEEELESLQSIRGSQAILRQEDFEYISKARSYHTGISLSPSLPVRSNLIDPDLQRKWIDMHEEKVRAPLQRLCDSLVHISFKDLEISFEKSIDAFNLWLEEQEHKDYLCVIADGKSNIWMAELALPHLSRLPKEIWNCDLDTFTQSVFDSKWDKRLADIYLPHNVVLFDDGIYSGEQMTKFIGSIMGTFVHLNDILGASPPKIIVVSAYAASYGIDKVKKASENYYRVMTSGIPSLELLEEKVKRGDQSVDDLKSVVQAKDLVEETKKTLESLKLDYNLEKKEWKKQIKALSPSPDEEQLFELRKAFDAKHKPYREAKIEFNLAKSRYEMAVSDANAHLQKIKTATERQGKVVELFSDRIIVMPYTAIQTVAQVLEGDSDTIDVLNKMWWPEETGADIYSKGAESHGAFYFDHKVPDLVSFPEALELGLIFSSDNRVLTTEGYLKSEAVNSDSSIYEPLSKPVTIPLIPKTISPYKPDFDSFKKEISRFL